MPCLRMTSLHGGPITQRWQDRATAGLHGLGEEGGDGLMTLCLNEVIELLGVSR